MNKALLKQILTRKNENHPVIAIHAIDQPLADDLSGIIIELMRKLDSANVEIDW
jgi:hypothetical protein